MHSPLPCAFTSPCSPLAQSLLMFSITAIIILYFFLLNVFRLQSSNTPASGIRGVLMRSCEALARLLGSDMRIFAPPKANCTQGESTQG